MEDEECLPENSSLKLYLQDLGFSDLQIVKNTSQSPSSIRFEVSKPKSKLPCLETIEEDVIDQISIIVSTQMLFEEDVSNVEKLLSNFKIVKNGVLKSMFKNFLGVAVIFVGLCLYWVVGYYAFFIVSSFYAFIAAEYLARKHGNRTRLKKLTSILESNFILLKKTVKFIEENRLIEASSDFENNSVEFIEGFDFYKNFKSDFLISVNEMILILIQSTQKLIHRIPLYDYIENPEYYLCNNYNKNYESANLSKLYEIYLLVQSEFLQRLILSLIPNIKLLPKDGFYELNKILTETCVSLMKIKNKLNKKFKFVFLNGIHSPKTKVEFKLPLKNKPQNNYFKEFILNIHETSKKLQNLLLKCRILEENAVTDKIPDHAEEELAQIQADLNACQRNIGDSFILLKKANFISENLKGPDGFKIQDEEEVKKSVEELNKIMVGYTDLDPKIEDEIFEAYFTNENNRTDLSDLDDFDLHDILERKLEKEYSKNVMKELKLKLVEKAKYWRKRERELLRKKGLLDENESNKETESSEEEKETEDKIAEPLLQYKSTFGGRSLVHEQVFRQPGDSDSLSHEAIPLNCQINYTDNGFEIESTTSQENENLDTQNTYGASVLPMNKGFLSDLNQARQRIFKSSFPVQEELFGDSGEDSSSEDLSN